MKKILGALALALVVSSSSAVCFAAEPVCLSQDSLFVQSLAQPAQQPDQPSLTGTPLPAVQAGSCINLHCGKDSDCWPHCGGEFGSYCSSNHWCTPY